MPRLPGDTAPDVRAMPDGRGGCRVSPGIRATGTKLMLALNFNSKDIIMTNFVYTLNY